MDKTQFSETITPTVAQTPDEFFTKIREESQKAEHKGRDLTVEEERKMQDGFAVEEMMHSAGWSIVSDILNTLMLHTWVDPRAVEPTAGKTSQEEWMWRELNAFHAANNAKELLEGLYGLVQEAHELQRIKLGETVDAKKMRF